MNVAEKKVSDLVNENPRIAGVFEELGIDFCCGGGRSLAEACREDGIGLNAALETLETVARDAGVVPAGNLTNESTMSAPPTQMSLNELVDHILETHHAYLEAEVPRLQELIAKVAAHHGDWEPRLGEIQREFQALSAELMQHMRKEEVVLFPMIRSMEANGSMPVSGCGSTTGPIRQMEFEHDEAGAALARIRALTDSFAIPDRACGSYRAMIQGLRDFSHDLHMHVHKENNILFPRAAALEAGLAP